jgi:hypothetical protein
MNAKKAVRAKRRGNLEQKRAERAQLTLEVICRGLVAYVSYLATCQGRHIYSEYVLYEAILRIGLSQGYVVRCEVPLVKNRHTRGDHRRVDFLFKGDAKKETCFAIEVKWTENETTDVRKDVKKLQELAKTEKCLGYILIFGKGVKRDQKTPRGLSKKNVASKVVEWDPGKTHYWARWYQVI